MYTRIYKYLYRFDRRILSVVSMCIKYRLAWTKKYDWFLFYFCKLFVVKYVQNK